MEMNDDAYGLIGYAWREPREDPALSYININSVPRQHKVEMEAEVEEDIYLVKKKVEDKIGQEKPQNQVNNEKLKEDGNQQNQESKTMMAAEVMTKMAAIKPLKCKRRDSRKWKCSNDAVVTHTLCEKHLSKSRSYYKSRKETRRVSSKSAMQKVLASSKAALAKEASSHTKAEVASDVSVVSSKAASSSTSARPSSKRARMEEVDDYSGGAFYYPEPFGPFRGKQRGHYSSN